MGNQGKEERARSGDIQESQMVFKVDRIRIAFG
jgi:hypothetical protein